MMIPKLHYIPKGNSPKEVLSNIQKGCTSGVELIQLGLQNISEKKFLKIAEEAREITAHFQTRLIIEQHHKIAKIIKADGVLLERADTSLSEARKLLYTWQMIGGMAHNLQEAEALLVKDVDYIELGPFKSSLSDAPLGLNGYSLLVEALKTKTPIIGFGGHRYFRCKIVIRDWCFWNCCFKSHSV